MADAVDDEDCVLCKVFKRGWCQNEFKDFDSCFENAKEKGLDEERCYPMFDAFQKCMAKKVQMDKLFKAAVGKEQ